MGVLDLWLLLYIPYLGLYNKTHREYTMQLEKKNTFKPV